MESSSQDASTGKPVFGKRPTTTKRLVRAVVSSVEVVAVLVVLGQLNACFNFFPYRLARKPDPADSARPQPPRGDLTRLADFYGTDKGTGGHGFTEVYEDVLGPLKLRTKKVLEIGIERGASLRMFADYFPSATVYGIDVERRDFLFWDAPRIKAFVADQANREQLRTVLARTGGDFDLILDDGGHSMEQQQVSVAFLFPFVKPGGYYILEDVHTSFMGSQFGVADDGSNTTYRVITNYLADGQITSGYMRREEKAYLSANIESLDLVATNRSSITCIIKKKG